MVYKRSVGLAKVNLGNCLKLTLKNTFFVSTSQIQTPKMFFVYQYYVRKFLFSAKKYTIFIQTLTKQYFSNQTRIEIASYKIIGVQN